MQIRTIDWKNNSIRIIDQTALPAKLRYLELKSVSALWQAIKKLRVRGAPALGAAAALGIYLAVKDSAAQDYKTFEREIDRAADYLGSSRPTAVNLFWGLKMMRQAALENRDKPIARIKAILLHRARQVMEEDSVTCRKLARYGSTLIRSGDNIMTVCNAGSLATVDYGTALGVIFCAKSEGKALAVYACETRPLLQGARLTAWELKTKGIKVTLLCDNAAATLMSSGKVDKVIVGADRIAANGDTANKVGTYNVALLAKYHHIPFYVAAPLSSFDLSKRTGKDIPIEQRHSREVTHYLFKRPVAPPGVAVFNPAFDVTPHHLISAIITEKGIIRPPFAKKIRGIAK
jgi:methylthioribose-1-phosphate isomerase